VVVDCYNILSLFYFVVNSIMLFFFLVPTVVVDAAVVIFCYFYSLDCIQHSLEVTCMLCLEQLRKFQLDQPQSCHC
jgi:hypothetical protein